MQDIINRMGQNVKAIFNVPTTPDGYHIINSNAARNISQCITEFAEIFKNYDTDMYKYINGLAERIFYPQREIWFGINTGDYVVNNKHLGYLDAAVDFSTTVEFQNKTRKKSPKIFVSHSSKDVDYVKAFVTMLEKIGTKKEHLFCSSIAGYNITLNENIYDFLRNQFDNFNLYVILLLSKDYYKSPACLNEMGAAWMLKANYQAILLPSFNFKSISGAIDPQKISFTLDDTKERAGRLSELKNNVINFLGLNNIDEIIWERHKTDFIEEVDKTTESIKNKQGVKL